MGETGSKEGGKMRREGGGGRRDRGRGKGGKKTRKRGEKERQRGEEDSGGEEGNRRGAHNHSGRVPIGESRAIRHESLRLRCCKRLI